MEEIPLESPSMSRRQLLNFLTGEVVATTASAALYTTVKFFFPQMKLLFVIRQNKQQECNAKVIFFRSF